MKVKHILKNLRESAKSAGDKNSPQIGQMNANGVAVNYSKGLSNTYIKICVSNHQNKKNETLYHLSFHSMCEFFQLCSN
jgi:hypothetical protein